MWLFGVAEGRVVLISLCSVASRHINCALVGHSFKKILTRWLHVNVRRGVGVVLSSLPFKSE